MPLVKAEVRRIQTHPCLAMIAPQEPLVVELAEEVLVEKPLQMYEASWEALPIRLSLRLHWAQR